jgi:hypothetical protein
VFYDDDIPRQVPLFQPESCLMFKRLPELRIVMAGMVRDVVRSPMQFNVICTFEAGHLPLAYPYS